MILYKNNKYLFFDINMNLLVKIGYWINSNALNDGLIWKTEYDDQDLDIRKLKL